MKHWQSYFTAATLVTFAIPAIAGGWAQGYGETPEKGIESAMKAAEAIVKSRGKGCVGPGKSGGEAIRYIGKEKDLYKFEALYSHHNGSCGKHKTIADYRKELGI
jgi:hypothetical protein